MMITFPKTFQSTPWVPNEVFGMWCSPNEDFRWLNDSERNVRWVFSTHFWPSQSKILEGRTNISERTFEALFRGVSTRFGIQNAEKCFEGAFWNVRASFQNLRLGSMTFQWLVAEICDSHPWKVRRKDSSNDSFSHRAGRFTVTLRFVHSWPATCCSVSNTHKSHDDSMMMLQSFSRTQRQSNKMMIACLRLCRTQRACQPW